MASQSPDPAPGAAHQKPNATPNSQENGASQGNGAQGYKHYENSGFDPQAWRQLLGPKHWLSWLCLGLLAVVSYLPNRLRDWLAWLLAWPLCVPNPRFKKIVLANLHTVFPEYSDAQCRIFYRKMLVHALIAALSYGEPVFLPKSWLGRRWVIKNKEVLAAALATGQPIIFCVPHSFYLDRGGLYLSYAGLPMFAMVNEQKNPVFDWFLNYQRIIFGGSIHTRDAGFRSMLRALKQGRHLYIACDEDLGKESALFVDYFGVPKATLGSVPRLAAAAKAQLVVLCSSYNLKTCNFELSFRALPHVPSKDTKADLLALNQALEQELRQVPEQYMWFLRLFKTVPDERYFIDIYANCHKVERPDIAIDYEHRRKPLEQPLFDSPRYQPIEDYSPAARAQRAAEQAAASASSAQTPAAAPAPAAKTKEQ